MGYIGHKRATLCAWPFSDGHISKFNCWHVVGSLGMATLLGYSRATHGPLHASWTGCMGGPALAMGWATGVVFRAKSLALWSCGKAESGLKMENINK